MWWLYLKIPVPHPSWITERTKMFIISSLEIRLRRKRYFWWSWFWLYSEIISRKALGMMPSCVFCHPSIIVIIIRRWLDEKYLIIGLELWSRLESSSRSSYQDPFIHSTLPQGGGALPSAALWTHGQPLYMEKIKCLYNVTTTWLQLEEWVFKQKSVADIAA